MTRQWRPEEEPLPPKANEEPMAGTDGRRTSAWLTTQQWWRVLKISTMRHFTSGGHFMAAAIAFYALIALAPLGMLLAAMLQRLFESVIVSDAAYRSFEALVGEWAGGATNHIMDLVRSQAESQNRMVGGTLTANILSAGIFVWTGLRLFDIIQISLGTIWPGRRVRGVVFRKLVSLAMMLVSGLLFVTVIFLLSTRGAINEWLSRLEGPNIPLVVPHSIVAFGIGLIISTLAYLLLYKFMPVQKVSTRAAFAGALFAAVIWQGLSPIFTRFIALSQYFHTVFETLLWVIIFGLWAFWGAQIMLFGAQFVAAFEHVFIQRRPRGEDDALVDVTRRRTQTYVGDLDAEAERIIEELQLNREPAACALDSAGNKLVNGIILGGGKISHLFAERVGTDIKGLIKVDGRASVEYVVAAMRGVPGMGKIVLVGDKAAFLHHPVAEKLDGIIDEGPDIWHNLMRAIRYLGEDKRILLSSSDTPLLTAESLCAFLGQCDADADLCVPVTPKLPTKELFGNRIWIYLPLREGWITHTSNVLFDPRLVLRNQDFAERFLSRRKDLWGAAGTIGLRFTLRFFFSWIFPFLRYDMQGMAHQIEVMLGARRCQGVMLDYPEIALDIDKPTDVDEIEAFIQREKQAGRWQPSLNQPPV